MVDQSHDAAAWDVIVIGAGGAGLAATVAAAEQGAKVLLVEKNCRLGGTTGIAVGSFSASQTRLQASRKIDDDATAHNEDIGKFNPRLEPRNNWALRQVFTEHAGPTLTWLEEMGLRFYGPSPEPPNRVPRMHNVVPNAKAYIARMTERSVQLGVQILSNTKVDHLVRENDGPVTGVQIVDRHTGRTRRLLARRGVVLAAGDYANSSELKSEFADPRIARIEGINPTATGDGHRMAMQVGAELVNMDVIYGPELRFVPPPRKPLSQLMPSGPVGRRLAAACLKLAPAWLVNHVIKQLMVTWQHPETSLFEHGALLVNARGERFTNELGEPCYDVPDQPGKTCYILFGRKIADRFSQWPNFISTAPDIAYAYVRDYERLRPDLYACAPSIMLLATRAGMEPQVLEATVTRCAQAAVGVVPDVFGRTSWGDGFAQGPFYLLGPAKAWTVTTEGGVRIDEGMQVLDRTGKIIDHLYAAGCNGLGGMVMWGHGLHIAWAITSGRLAGTHAARCGTS